MHFTSFLFVTASLIVLPLVFSQEGSAATPTKASTTQYACPATCVRPECVCASKDSPLPIDKTPMFITITWDDAIQANQEIVISGIMNSSVNQNGCFLPATYFTSTVYSEWQIVLNKFWSGNEIAAHTINHFDLTKVANPASEIAGSIQIISQAGIPKNKITGFRHPFLSFNKASFDAMFSSGITYESSVTLDPISQGYWPFTLNYGYPYDLQPCVGCPPGPSFIYPGKWTIPMYNIVDKNNLLYASMDPPVTPQLGPASYAVALDNLKYSFKVHYDKKLPFGLYQHAAQFIVQTPENNGRLAELMKEFLAWTLTEFKDTWYVTNQQLISWIKTPVPIAGMQAAFPCLQPPVDKSNVEVCDGIDNDGDGVVDNGLFDSCSFDANGSWQSCYGCPSSFPNVSNANPTRTGIGASRAFIPADGCQSTSQSWDPSSQKCVEMKRPAALTRVEAGLPGTGGKASGTSSAFGHSSGWYGIIALGFFA